MDKVDERALREWVDLDLEGELEASRKARLEAELTTRPALAAERRRLVALRGLLAESRVAVDAGFQSRVMDALPRAAWEKGADRRPAWVLPLALAAVFAVAGVLALGLGGSESHVLGLGLTVFDFLQATIVAGSGLALAAWRGVGFGLEELVSGSGLSLLGLLVLVLFVDLLFLALLRRRRTAEERSSEADRHRDERR